MIPTVQAQLSFERYAGDAEMLRYWFDRCAALVGDQLYRELQHTEPWPDAFNQHVGSPLGPPGSAWAMIELTRRYPKGPRRRRRVYSVAEWQQFLKSLDDRTAQAKLLIARLNDEGFFGIGGAVVDAAISDRHPNWIFVQSLAYEDWVLRPDNQRALLTFLRGAAEQCNPTFGSIGYETPLYRSVLEDALGVFPADTIPDSSSQLRGYGWLTICSQQIGDALGGLDALRRSGAFHEVTNLPGGGYWMLATATYQEYDMPAAARVFHVVASKLPPGKPIGGDGRHEQNRPPELYIGQDAATYQHRDR